MRLRVLAFALLAVGCGQNDFFVKERLVLQAPSRVIAAGPVELRVQLVENVERVDIVDETTTLPSTVASGPASGKLFTTFWVVGPQDEGMWTLLAKARLRSGEEVRSEPVPVDVSLGAAPSIAAPTGLTATGQSRAVELSWGSVPGATGYNLYRSRGAQTPWVAVSAPSGTKVTDPGLDEGATYHYRVTALGWNRRANQRMESVPSAEVSATTIRGNAPTVRITSPASGETLTSPQVTVRVDATDDGSVTRVQLYDGASLEATDTSAPFELTWALTPAKNGPHTLTARALDESGNETTSAAVNVTVNLASSDTTPPAVTMALPTQGATYTTAGALDVAATASDNVGVTRVEFFRNGASFAQDTDGANGWSTSFAYTAAHNGSQAFTARAFDAAGNATTSAPVTVTINIATADTTPPTVSLAQPANNTTYTAAGTVNLVANAQDNVGVTRVEFARNGAALSQDTDGSNGWTASFAFTAAHNGNHTFTARALDAAGNNTTSLPVLVTINIAVADSTPPAVSIALPSTDQTVTTAGSLDIVANATDNIGVTRVEFHKNGTFFAQDTDGSNGFSATFNYSGGDNGAHAFVAHAFDAAGNTAASATRTITVNINTTGPDLFIRRTEWGQTVFGQNLRLVTGKQALLRAHVLSTQAGVGSPVVNVVGTRAGSTLGTLTLTGPATVPTAENPGDLNQSFRVLVPATWVASGVQLTVRVDVNNSVSESNESNNTQVLNPAVGAGTTLHLTEVPIVHRGVTGTVPSHSPTLVAQWPLLAVSPQRRAAYTFSGTLGANDTNSWSTLLSEVSALRNTDNSRRYYYGFVRPGYTSGIYGLGYVGYPAAIGYDTSLETITHELGHNFGRNHAPCGTGGDPNYPYAGGRIGSWGYDLATGALKNPASYYDTMSYCSPTWVSDYNYGAVQTFLEQRPPSPTALPEDAPEEELLLVAGRVREGQVELRPVQRLFTHRLAAAPAGETTLRVTFESGTEEVALELLEVADVVVPERHFVALVPAAGEVLRLEVLGKRGSLYSAARTVTEPPPQVEVDEKDGFVTVRWNAATHPHLAVAHLGDERTTLGLWLDGGLVRLPTTALPAGGRFEVSASSGLTATRLTFAR